MGASILEEAFLRATWARAQSSRVDAEYFTIQKVNDGVYAALAKPQVMINCNAAIFVNSHYVVVVDAHARPSVAAALIAQIKRDITTKPVRYLVNSHFHGDHTQGNSAYKLANPKIDIVSSDTTKQLMSQLSRNRVRESLDRIPETIDGLQARQAKATSVSEREFCNEQIRQLKDFLAEMKNYSLELPNITFSKSHVIKDRSGDLHLEFRGRAHTAGDIVVFSPRTKVVATGDIVSGYLPNMGDGYPKPWPTTIDSVGELSFNQVITGHGPVQRDRTPMTQLRNYLEELTENVEAGKKAGKPLAELQKTITVTSLKSLQSNEYRNYVQTNMETFQVYLGQKAPLDDKLFRNIAEVYKNLDRV